QKIPPLGALPAMIKQESPSSFLHKEYSGLYKRTIIPELQEELGKPKLPETTPLLHRKCPVCKKGNLVTIATFTARGPPLHWQEQIKKQLNRPIQKNVDPDVTGLLWPPR